jgi:hypothetical protein
VAIIHPVPLFLAKLWNQVPSSSLSRWMILTLEKIKTCWVLWFWKVQISNNRQLCINCQLSAVYKSELCYIITPRSPEFQIPKWPEEGTWFHRFGFWQGMTRIASTHFQLSNKRVYQFWSQFPSYLTVPLGDWLEKKKVPSIIRKQQFGFPIRTT